MRKLTTMGAIAVLAAFAAPAWAEVVVNQSIDMNLAAFVPCANGGAGEVVRLSGPLHVLITFTINDNQISGKTHFQPQGISGTGMTTGDTYQATGVTQDHFSSSLQNGQFNQTYVNNFRIIGHGPGNNFLVHENFHIAVNANGELSTAHDNFSVDCK